MGKDFNIFNILTPKASTFYLLDDSSLRQALEKFSVHKFSVVPIINKNGEYVGTISEGDILRYISFKNDFNKNISESTTILDIERYRSYDSTKIDARFNELFNLALSQNFIPIVDDRNIFIGIIKRKDIFIYLKPLIEV